LEIPWDEGPKNYQEFKAKFSQVHRLKSYRKALDHLKNSGNLFACDCSRRQINRESPDGSYPGTCKNKMVPFNNKEASWRLNTDMNKEVSYKDVAGKDVTASLPSLLKDFVVLRKDGLPAYQLTSVVDDMMDKIDLIVRGKDLWGSSIAQVYLGEKLPGAPLKGTQFFHHALMTDSKNRKMSKSSGASSIQQLIKAGVDRAEIYRMIGEFLKLKPPISNFEEFQNAYK